jgi:hypothetical protein
MRRNLVGSNARFGEIIKTVKMATKNPIAIPMAERATL